MIVVKLQGGLGNQMFQYAAARALSENRPVYIDQSFLLRNKRATPAFTPRSYELGIFKKNNAKILSSFLTFVLTGNRIECRLLRKIFFPGLNYHHDDAGMIQGDVNNVYLDGYFQSEDHFKTIRTQLLHEFEFPVLNDMAAAWQQKIANAANAVSIHVRRGDYLNPEIEAYHGLLPDDYYIKAIGLIESEITDPTYFVFSDDPEWCRSAFSFLGADAQIVSHDDKDCADMALMSMCKHHIIANSSFSWWAAWLNTSVDKIIIAPQEWLKAEEPSNKVHSLVPENWITL